MSETPSRETSRDNAMSVAAISSERIESDDNVWTRRLVLFLRIMAVFSVIKGLYHWAQVTGFIGGEEEAFENQPMAWQTATVYFAVDRDVLTPDAQKDLDDLAKKAQAEKGYVIEVAGFADTTGKLSHNQVLSERRANAVVRYLEQNGDIPIHRILPLAGMGITHEAADNKTREGRKMNRRVEVKILVNQGVVAGMAQQSGSASAKPPSEASK